MRFIAKLALSAAVGIAGLGLAGTAAQAAPATTAAQVAGVTAAADDVALLRDCTALNNLDEVAAKFISRCRKGSINREFPDSHRPRNLGEIRNGSSADDKKAWKLLNDNRFKK